MRRFRRSRTGTPATGAPSPTLGNITFSSVNWDLNAAAGAVLAAVIGKTASSAIAPLGALFTANAIVMSSDNTQVLRGLGAWTAGSSTVTPRETLGGATNNPHDSTAISVTIAAAGPAIPDLYPAAGYNGTAGSGWGGLGVPRPVASTMRAKTDPARATLSCAEDNRQAMVRDMVLTFFAAARDGALAGIGVSKVRVYCEGRYVDVTSVGPRTRPAFDPAHPNECRYDNVSGVEWGQHVNLKHASFPQSGWVEIFAESFPTDAAKATTVIGPILVKRKTGAYYDQTFVWDGTTYANTDAGFNAAVNAAGAAVNAGAEHVRIKPVGAHTYDPSSSSGLFFTYAHQGHLDVFCDLTGGTTGTLHITKPTNGPCTPTNQFGLDFSGTRWGPGVKIDFKRIGSLFALYGETGGGIGIGGYSGRRIASICGAEIYNSGGSYQLGGGAGGTTPGSYDEAKTTREDGGTAGSFAGQRFFECNYHDMHIGLVNAQIARNVTVNTCGQDQMRPIGAEYAGGIVQWSHWYNVQIFGFSLVIPNTNTPAIALTGPASITVETTGTPDGTRQVVFKRSGVQCYPTGAANSIVNTATAPGGVFTPDAGCYYVQDVVNAINARAAADGAGVGMNGVVATLLDNTKRAAVLGGSGIGLGNLSPTALSGTPYNLVTRFDIHGDGYQSQGGQPRNLNRINCAMWNGAGQEDFRDYLNACDIATINQVNTMAARDPAGLSRLIGDESHCFDWHTTQLGQALSLATTNHVAADQNYQPDGDCEIQAGIYSAIFWEGVAATGGESTGPIYRDPLKINGNFLLQDNGEAIPSGGAGYGTNYTGGTMASLVNDGFNMDITPKAAVLAHLQPQRVPFDRYGVARGALTAAGAMVAAPGG